MSNYKITTRKTASGHFTVIIFDNNKWQEIGKFNTTNASLIDDIQEMNEKGLESKLINFDTFKEIIEFCLQKIKQSA